MTRLVYVNWPFPSWLVTVPVPASLKLPVPNVPDGMSMLSRLPRSCHTSPPTRSPGVVAPPTVFGVHLVVGRILLGVGITRRGWIPSYVLAALFRLGNHVPVNDVERRVHQRILWFVGGWRSCSPESLDKYSPGLIEVRRSPPPSLLPSCCRQPSYRDCRRPSTRHQSCRSKNRLFCIM